MKKHFGLEISSHALHICPHRRPGQARSLALPANLFTLSATSDCPGDPTALRSFLRQELAPLLPPGSRLALALPDRCGRHLDLALPGKRLRGNISEQLKWHLRDQLPLAPAATRLAWSSGGRNPAGAHLYQAVAAGQQQLRALEQLCQDLSWELVLIDLRTSALNHALGHQLEKRPLLLLYQNEDSLSLQLYDRYQRCTCRQLRLLSSNDTDMLAAIDQTLSSCPAIATQLDQLHLALHSTLAESREQWAQTLSQHLGRPLTLVHLSGVVPAAPQHSVAAALAARLG